MSALEHVSLITAFLLVMSPNLSAQDSSRVVPGTRVRISAPTVDAKPLKGTVVAVSPGILTLNVDGLVGDTWDPRLEIPVEAVTGLEVSLGRHSRVAKGALFGGLIGGAIGLVGGAASTTGDDFCCDASAIPAVTAVLAVAGAGVGAVVGLLSSGERWEVVSLDQIRVEPALTATGGASVALRLRLQL